MTLDCLLELVFKNFPIEKIPALLKNLTTGGKNIANYHLTCESSDFHLDEEESIANFFINNPDFGLFINLTELNRVGVCIPKCCIAVYRYSDSVELNLNFEFLDLKKLEKNNLQDSMMRLAKSIAMENQIDDYFGGIEPAAEAKNRLFTQETPGPLKIC